MYTYMYTHMYIYVYVCYRGLFMNREIQLSLSANVQLSTDILKAAPYFFIVFIQILSFKQYESRKCTTQLIFC